MIIRAHMLILSEYPNYNRDILYNLQASLPRSLIMNAWGYVPRETRKVFIVSKRGSDANKFYKTYFIVRVFRKNEHPCPDDHSLFIYHNSLLSY